MYHFARRIQAISVFACGAVGLGIQQSEFEYIGTCVGRGDMKILQTALRGAPFEYYVVGRAGSMSLYAEPAKIEEAIAFARNMVDGPLVDRSYKRVLRIDMSRRIDRQGGIEMTFTNVSSAVLKVARPKLGSSLAFRSAAELLATDVLRSTEKERKIETLKPGGAMVLWMTDTDLKDAIEHGHDWVVWYGRLSLTGDTGAGEKSKLGPVAVSWVFLGTNETPRIGHGWRRYVKAKRS